MKKFYITTPIYYVNAKPHIGHIYTTLAADVLARYYRQKGREVFFLTGTDEHGQKIAQAAQDAGKEPQELADDIAKLFRETFKNLSISNDDFIRTTEARHKKEVQKFLERIEKYIYRDKYQGLYCAGCEKFLTEKDLEDGRCQYHRKRPEKISEENYFFELKFFLPKIKKLIETDKFKIEPVERKNEALEMLKELEDFSISRERVAWGIPFPGDKSQTIYCWADALLNYWTAGSELWPPDVQFIGKDILRFHAIYWPALLLAAGEKLPKRLFVHGFFTVNGQKMSKSLGNIIDPNDLVNKFGADATRYLILSQFPFGQDGDFSEDKFKARYNADLANDLGNLINRTKKLLENIKPGPEDKDFAIKLDKFILDFKLDQALEFIWQKIKWANKFIDTHRLWESKDQKKLGQVKIAIEQIKFALDPFLPETKFFYPRI